MNTDQVVALGRAMIVEAATLIAPLLILIASISLLVNILQVLTSLQDQTLSAVPRLLATGAALFLIMPWMWRHLALYTTHLLSDFSTVLQ
jgi:flagellar biosynthetic protein FliQ